MANHEKLLLMPNNELAKHLANLKKGKRNIAKELAEAFKQLLAAEGALIHAIIKAAQSGKAPKAGQELKKLTKTPNFKAMEKRAQELDYKTIGIVRSGAIHAGGSVRRLDGVLTSTSAPGSSLYYYGCIGGSIGYSAGAEFGAGFLVSQEPPSKCKGTHLCLSLGGDFIGGVSVELFTDIDIFKKNAAGMVILLNIGEAIDASIGVSYSNVHKIL